MNLQYVMKLNQLSNMSQWCLNSVFDFHTYSLFQLLKEILEMLHNSCTYSQKPIHCIDVFRHRYRVSTQP